jgi:hypothetical protein
MQHFTLMTAVYGMPRPQRTAVQHRVLPVKRAPRSCSLLTRVSAYSLLWWLIRKGDDVNQLHAQSVSPPPPHPLLALSDEELEQLSRFLWHFKEWSIAHWNRCRQL